jgi:hypothetical protein
MNQLTTTAGNRRGIAAPATIGEMMRLSEMLADSGMVPRDYQGKPGNVFVALQMGAEVGLPPMAALQNIAVIGNRPGLFGDGALAVVRTHPEFVSIEEGTEGEGDARHGWCVLERAGQKPVRREFSVADAKKAKLWGKAGPWTDYSDRMLMMRARMFSMRDLFTDALRGIGIVEEIRDIPPEPRDVPNLAQQERAAPPRATGPVTAAPGSLAEHAAMVTGRAVELPPETPAEEGLPLIYLDGRLVEVRRGAKSGAPAVMIWQRAAETQIARAGSAEALRGWRAANGPSFGSIAQLHPREVEQVEGLIAARLDRMRDAEAEDMEQAEAAAEVPPPAETPTAAEAPA